MQPMHCAEVAPVVSLGKEVADNIDLYSKNALICIFFLLWPSLPNLYPWITNHWSPLVDGPMENYPSARGFLVVGFISSEEKRATLDHGMWVLDSHPLSFRPWVLSFNPFKEPLDVMPV